MEILDIIQCRLSDFFKENPLNKIEELDNLIIFDEPLIGIASANDPLFMKLKDEQAVGEHHLLPNDFMAEGKSVISYFLPFSLRVRESNRTRDGLPSFEWLYGRIEGETFNDAVKEFIVNELEKLGVKACIPSKDSRYKSINLKSTWSERHVAFIAGLGTFGLSKSLITEKGSAGRIGSIIVDIPLSPTPRKYEDIYEYCSNCGACIPRCPAKAISKAGKEHPPCNDFLNNVTKKKFSPRYGCGKCQTAVPCESRIPKKLKI